MAHIPVMIDLADQKVLIIGGGSVALRKLRVLLKTGARIKIVAKKPCAGLQKFAIKQSFELHTRAFRMPDLKNSYFVVIATDDLSLNQKIALRCETLGLLYNSATDKKARVLMSSFFRRGDLVISASTNGVAPKAAQMITKALSKVFDSSWIQTMQNLK